MIRRLVVVCLSLCVADARADICDYYKEHLPALASLMCERGKRQAKPAGSHSTFSSAFSVSPSTIPTEPSLYGIEIIASYLRSSPTKWNPQFSLIKGFHKFGTGVSTGGDNTFYSNDVLQRARGPSLLTSFAPHEPSQGYVTNISFGASTAIVGSRKDSKRATVNLGAVARYNKMTNTVGGGPGLSLNMTHAMFGISVSHEKLSNFWPRLWLASAYAGVRYSVLELEYTILKNFGGADLQPVHIGALTLDFGRLMTTVAVRHLNYLSEGEVWQPHLSLQFRLSKRFTFGFLLNHIPGANSLASQIFF